MWCDYTTSPALFGRAFPPWTGGSVLTSGDSAAALDGKLPRSRTALSC